MRTNPWKILALVLLFAAARGVFATEKPKQESRRAESEGSEQSGAAASTADPFKVQCGHNIPTYACDECRYEIGMVKLATELFQKEGRGLLRTEQVSRKKAETFIEATGEVCLNDNAVVHVTPRVAGIVTKVTVDIGAKVRQGDVLFEIESVELGEAMGAYLKSRTLSALSQKNYEREKALFEQKVSSEADLIEMQMAYEVNAADLNAAEHKLHVLGLKEKEVAAIKPDEHMGLIGSLPFRAPMDGIVMEKHATIGEMAEPGDNVMLLADLSTLWVWLDIYEQDLAALLRQGTNKDTTVVIETRAFPGQIFKGTINQVGSTMNEETRTVKVRVTTPNPEGLLRPGMFCMARIVSGAGGEVLAIPRSAALHDEGSDFVFKHAKEDYYVRQAVKKGREFVSMVEILEGLEPGETIVTDGAFILKSDVLREKMGAGCAD
jgi:membrane fusion protein, heavy metal efflux system